MTLTRPFASFVFVVFAASAASCGGGSSGGGTNSPKPVIQKAATASGDAQTGIVAAALANPLRVLVTLGGSPLAGDTVTWSTSGGASVSPALSISDAGGIAATTWTLGETAGTQSATATLAGATGSPVTFTASATAGAAAQLSLASGDNQAGAPSTTLTSPPVVRATDAFGNAVAGVAVAWAVASGPATVTPASSTTDATGTTNTTVQFGASTGSVVVTATSAGLTGSPVTFHLASATPASAAVQIGDNFFKSGQNATQNPAVDTVAVGTTVTWTWSGAASHSVESTGTPSFTSSVVKAAGTYTFTFVTAGTYTYDCAVHGAAMTGRIVVK